MDQQCLAALLDEGVVPTEEESDGEEEDDEVEDMKLDDLDSDDEELGDDFGAEASEGVTFGSTQRHFGFFDTLRCLLSRYGTGAC